MFQRPFLFALGGILDVFAGLLDRLADACGCLVDFLAGLFDRAFLRLAASYAGKQGTDQHDCAECLSGYEHFHFHLLLAKYPAPKQTEGIGNNQKRIMKTINSHPRPDRPEYRG